MFCFVLALIRRSTVMIGCTGARNVIGLSFTPTIFSQAHPCISTSLALAFPWRLSSWRRHQSLSVGLDSRCSSANLVLYPIVPLFSLKRYPDRKPELASLILICPEPDSLNQSARQNYKLQTSLLHRCSAAISMLAYFRFYPYQETCT